MSFILGEAFLGVLAGFALNRVYDSYRDSQNRGKLKENIKHELKDCENRLTGEGLLLPTTFWDAATISGDLRLLSYNERMMLSSVYFEIDNHNFQARMVKNTEVMSGAGNRHLILDGQTAARAYWVKLNEILIKDEEPLKQRIATLLESFHK